jgi:alpha-glucosidase (family GH31 glycosyl hydrolase)
MTTPQIAPNAANLLLGRGALYFDRFASGTMNRQGEVHLGNVTKLEITTTDEAKEKYSSMVSTSALLKSVNVKRTVEVKLTADEFSLANMALALMGSEGTLTQAASTAADETVTTSAKHGRWYPLAKRNVSSVVITGKVEDTDYQVDAETGRIYIIPGGAITEGSTVTVASYSYGTIDYKTIVGANANVIEGYLRFIGDPATGPEFELEVWRVQAQPDGAFGLITEDYGNFSLTLKVLDDSANHATEPYYRLLART